MLALEIQSLLEGQVMLDLSVALVHNGCLPCPYLLGSHLRFVVCSAESQFLLKEQVMLAQSVARMPNDCLHFPYPLETTIHPYCCFIHLLAAFQVFQAMLLVYEGRADLAAQTFREVYLGFHMACLDETDVLAQAVCCCKDWVCL